jgi:hypothetical protein
MAHLGRLLTPPLWNCFWLTLPVLALNAAFAGRLPAAFQPDIFWRDIPPALGAAENVLRTLALALTLFMPIGRRARAGFALYALGLLAYLGSWLPLLLAPQSAWSASAAGFLAPALTPALWLSGIGMVGAGRSRRLTAAYAASAAIFLAAHLCHAALVLSRPG